MKNISAFECEGCEEIFKTKDYITNCKVCGKETCEECSSYGGKVCWNCHYSNPQLTYRGQDD